MESKKLHISWCVSLFLIGLATIVLAGSRIVGIELNDTVVTILGVTDLLALPVLVFTTVKKMKTK